MMSWYYKNKPDVDLDTFDPDESYTDKQLEAYADAFLKKDKAEVDGESNTQKWQKEYGILFDDHLASRKRREILTALGTPDPAFTGSTQESSAKTSGDGQAMFFRSHPEGRKVNSKEQRKRNGAGYYRN